MNTRYWQQLHIPLPGQAADAAAELLEAFGALSVSSEGDGGEERFDLAEPSMEHWSATRLTALFEDGVPLDPVIAAIARVFDVAPADCTVERFADRDWERAWLERYRPVEITPDLWICPTWCEPPPGAKLVLTLDPGLAFGTGTHATTALCLEHLAGAGLTGRSVLDFGCGSGILAIAAARLGAAQVIACDIDPRAVDATRENAVQNGVGGQIRILSAADATAAIESGTVCVDMVIANILAGALVTLSATLTRAMAPGGSLVLSGILRDQRERVASAFPALEFSARSRDDWVLLAS